MRLYKCDSNHWCNMFEKHPNFYMAPKKHLENTAHSLQDSHLKFPRDKSPIFLHLGQFFEDFYKIRRRKTLKLQTILSCLIIKPQGLVKKMGVSITWFLHKWGLRNWWKVSRLREEEAESKTHEKDWDEEFYKNVFVFVFVEIPWVFPVEAVLLHHSLSQKKHSLKIERTQLMPATTHMLLLSYNPNTQWKEQPLKKTNFFVDANVA